MSKFASREVADVTLKKLDGTPVIRFDSLKVTGLETSAETVYARGGKGNARLIGFDGEREANFNFEDALISPEAIAMIGGSEVVVGAKAVHKSESFIGGGTVTLSETALTIDKKVFKIVDGVATDITATVTTNTVDLTTDSGKKVVIDYYYESSTNTKSVVISAEKFAGTYMLEAETLWRNEDGVDVPANFTIPKVKISSGLSIPMENSGDPATFSFEASALKPSDNADLVIIDIIEE